MNLTEFFNANEDEFLNSKAVENPKSSRNDLAAFILLNEILPGTTDIVAAAEHDQIWLGVDEDKLAEVITEAQALELMRYGVVFSDDEMYMHV